MRPSASTPPPRNSTGAAAATAAIDTGFGNWHSPIPYLFTGLAIVLGLIAIALLVLSCSYLHSPSDSHSPAAAASPAPDEQEKLPNGARDSEPTILVIMAGDDNPTFFAKQTTL
ncbi:protein GLUTAMINE DUMPER 4-like [Cucurbita pepo subsp. pepo]|uniref:protein GLUTAMINE DUMPER 4-like n=1 Tax=Cucurbita pepo subsp. pepo TaxID=3664 RepID=UPI000C9D50E4|nr:protein GLUTAMINE DUMPER 4-like [Cucurbita pepo subsp. pepo]